IDSGANRRASKRQFFEPFPGIAKTIEAMLHLAGVTAEFLAETDGGRILQMRPANLYDLMEGGGLSGQFAMETAKTGNQPALDCFKGRNMNGGRNDIVARLAKVHMIVWVNQPLP